MKTFQSFLLEQSLLTESFLSDTLIGVEVEIYHDRSLNLADELENDFPDIFRNKTSDVSIKPPTNSIGIEYTTVPVGLTNINKINRLTDFLYSIYDRGGRANESCGLHVHFSNKNITENQNEFDKKFNIVSFMVFLYETKFYKEFSKFKNIDQESENYAPISAFETQMKDFIKEFKQFFMEGLDIRDVDFSAVNDMILRFDAIKISAFRYHSKYNTLEWRGSRGMFEGERKSLGDFKKHMRFILNFARVYTFAGQPLKSEYKFEGKEFKLPADSVFEFLKKNQGKIEYHEKQYKKKKQERYVNAIRTVVASIKDKTIKNEIYKILINYYRETKTKAGFINFIDTPRFVKTIKDFFVPLIEMDQQLGLKKLRALCAERKYDLNLFYGWEFRNKLSSETVNKYIKNFDVYDLPSDGYALLDEKGLKLFHQSKINAIKNRWTILDEIPVNDELIAELIPLMPDKIHILITIAKRKNLLTEKVQLAIVKHAPDYIKRLIKARPTVLPQSVQRAIIEQDVKYVQDIIDAGYNIPEEIQLFALKKDDPTVMTFFTRKSTLSPKVQMYIVKKNHRLIPLIKDADDSVIKYMINNVSKSEIETVFGIFDDINMSHIPSNTKQKLQAAFDEKYGK